MKGDTIIIEQIRFLSYSNLIWPHDFYQIDLYNKTQDEHYSLAVDAKDLEAMLFEAKQQKPETKGKKCHCEQSCLDCNADAHIEGGCKNCSMYR